MLNWIAPYNVMLLHVNLTNDYMAGGALPDTSGDDIIPLINDLRPHFQQIGWIKEEHDPHHLLFATSHKGKKPFDAVHTAHGLQYLWPDHNVKGTVGAQFHPGLIVQPTDMVVVTGTDPHMHAFSAVKMDDRETIIYYADDGKSLTDKLRDRQIDTVVIDGLTFDFEVGWTAYDLVKAGFKVILLCDATRSMLEPIGDGRTSDDAMEEMLVNAGVILTTTEELPSIPLYPQRRLSA